MADRNNIITLPNPKLNKKSIKIDVIKKGTQNLVDKMTTVSLDWEDHHAHEVTVGLAAVQIGIMDRIVIIRNDFDNKEDKKFRALINPEIVKVEGDPVYQAEGCLSVAGYYGRVKRHPKITIKALDLDGKPVRITAVDFLARLLQHEIDHINGKTYIDRLDHHSELYEMTESGNLQLLDDEQFETALHGLKSH